MSILMKKIKNVYQRKKFVMILFAPFTTIQSSFNTIYVLFSGFCPFENAQFPVSSL